MDIIIQQKAGLSTKEYVIAVAGKAICYAYEAYRQFHNFIDILSPRGASPLIRVEIKRHRHIWREKFTIRINDERTLILKSSSNFHHTYALFDGKIRYEIIGHRGFNASIFREDKQIALLLKMNIVSVLAADRYQVQADKDVDLPLLIALALIWDSLYGDRTIDLGQFFERQQQDRSWQPKI